MYRTGMWVVTRARAFAVSIVLALSGATVAAPAACLVDTPGAPSCGASTEQGSTPRSNVAPRYVGNPIDAIGGNKYRREDDYRARGSPLVFSRHYNSALADHDVGLGHGWRHSYQVYLTRLDADTLRIAQSDGRLIEFAAVRPSEETGRRVYLSPGGHDGQVEALSGDHVWYLPDGRTITFRGSWPILFEREGVPNERLSLYYERRRLASVTDVFGRAIELRYTPERSGLPDYDDTGDTTLPGHLEAVILPGGLEVTIRYDRRANPSTVRYPDGAAVRFAYQDETWPHHLTRRVDATGERMWRYDETGRGTAYRDESTGESLTVDREDAEDGRSGTAVVKRGRGAESVYRWEIDGTGDGPVSAADARVVTIAERRCEDCEESVRRIPAPVDEPPAFRARDRPAADAPTEGTLTPLPDDPYTLTRVDELGRTVTVWTDFRGNVLDVERAGSSLNRLTGDFRSGSLGESEACDAGARRCLFEMGELIDILNQVERRAVPFMPRAKPAGTGTTGKKTGAAPRFCTLPDGRTCDELERDAEMAQLANCAYEGRTCVTMHREVSAQDIGLDPTLLENKGFSARLTQHVQTGEYVLAFRGTDEFSYDLKEDLMQFAGVATSQYRQAERLAKELEILLPGKKISYTGHSLGGGLATVAALTTKDEAIVFNSASLHAQTADTLELDMKDAGALVSVLSVDKEFVTTQQDRLYYPPGYQRPNHDLHVDRPQKEANPAPGRRYTLPRPPDAWMAAQKERASVFLRPESFRLHLMESAIKSIQTVREVACGA